jgi:hypothetical protein
MTRSLRIVNFLVLFSTLFMHGVASAACGSIPSNWPALGGSNLKVESGIKVNGNTATTGEFSGSKGVNPSSGAVQSVSTTFPTLDPATFPSFTGSSNLTAPSTIIAGTYGTITVNNGSSTPDTVFSSGTYYINTLSIGSSATVQLAPGDYFIKTSLSIASSAVLTVSPAGPVRFYLNTSPSISSGVKFNSGGNAANLQFYLYPGASTFEPGDNTQFTGIVFAPSTSQKIEFGDNSIITGALISAGTIELKSNSVLNYSATIQAQVASVSSCQSGGGGGGDGSTSPASFNCVESGASASTGTIYTKLAGTPFSFDVVTLKTDGSVETSYATSTNKNVTVELVDGSGTIACASRIPTNPAVSQTLSFAAVNSGRKAAASMTVSDAYLNLRCRVTDANQSPSIVGCSADNFAVRPNEFTVTSTSNADAAGLSSSATPALKTGANFALTAASGVAGYSNIPSLDASKVSAHAGAVQAGTLAGGFGSANPITGTATGSVFTYSEVGYFNLATNGVYDDSFTAVDSAVGDCTADFSNTAVSGKVGCKFGNTAATAYFGRFIPDHFALTPGAATPACNSSFTYFGQDGFSTLFTLISQNTDNITTQNYQGGFARLGLATWSVFNFSSASLPAGSLLSASATSPVGVWSLGVADVTAKHQASRPTALTGETSVVVQAAPIDLDGVTMASTAVAAAGTPLRYGRLLLQNAHGSELLDLPVSLTTQYWNGNAFVLNTNDSCSSISAPTSVAGLTFYPEVAATAQGNHLSAAETTATVSVTGILLAGDAQLKLSAPGPGNNGYLDLSIQAPNWLKFDWNAATAGNEDPSARATFGIYKGNDSQIYLREVY